MTSGDAPEKRYDWPVGIIKCEITVRTDSLQEGVSEARPLKLEPARGLFFCVCLRVSIWRGVRCTTESAVANLGLKKMAVKNRQLPLKCTKAT